MVLPQDLGTQADSAMRMCSVRAPFLATKVIECASLENTAFLSTSANIRRQNQIHPESKINRRLYAIAKNRSAIKQR